MHSSRAPQALPPPEELERRCRAMAVLDFIICPVEEARQYRFDAFYAPNERVATYDSYEGDGWLTWFTTKGTVIRGFWHESPLSPWAGNPTTPTPWPSLFIGLPNDLRNGPRTLIDGVEAVTFCLWWDARDPGWRTGHVANPDLEYADPDGSEWLLEPLSGVAAYEKVMEEVHERSLPHNVIQRIYRHEPLTADLVRAIEAGADIGQVMAAAKATSYPLGT
jgi:hypothetical protein